MGTESSWHPAFMPNTASDIITKETVRLSNPSSPNAERLPESGIPAFQSETQVRELTPDQVEDPGSEGPGREDNGRHPELSNLRDALTTSLASPGGVELDENPSHNGASNKEIITDDKADFPSVGPPNKHLSTMSFARTVSQEVSWGEDDEVDPEWNIRRTDSDPFQLMPQSDRTNSFPPVPPAHSQSIGIEPLHGQAEEIMNEVQQESRDMFADDGDGGDDDFFARGGVPNNEQSDFSSDTRNDTQDTFSGYGQTFGGDIRQEEDRESEARYEEGLPLVRASQEPQKNSTSRPSAFSDIDGSEDDFFGQVANSDTRQEASPKPHVLERKSTMQVMNSLHFQSHQQTHDVIVEEDHISSSQSSLEKATGGGVAASPSTILSQVLGDPEDPIHGQSEILANLAMDSGDGDLAEKWKAALAEDEFLDEEDDLLADDEPNGSKTLDPADLFGSDDEGFLEDTETQQTSTDYFSQENSSPIPTAVIGPNGHVIGFDTLTGSAHTNRPESSGNRPGSSSSRYLPTGAHSAVPLSNNLYAPAAPVFTDLTRSKTTGAVPSPYVSPATANFPGQLSQPQRPEIQKAQSFADKSKGGYSSPYDLPMDVVKPRKRVSMQTMNSGYNQSAPQAPSAPPRSKSMYTQVPPPSRGSTSSLSPPTSSHSFQQSQIQDSASRPQPVPPTLRSKGSFFEELPIAARPKIAPRHSSTQSAQGQGQYAPAAPPQHPPTDSHHHPPQQTPTQLPNPSQGLVAPERISPYASLPSSNVPPPATASRYSPAPPPLQSHIGSLPPVAQSRYSPAPPPQVRQGVPSYNALPVSGPQPPILPHQPRTSSPLAHFSQDSRTSSQTQQSNFGRRTSSSYESSLKPHSLPPTWEVNENDQVNRFSEAPNQHVQAPPSQPPLGIRQSQTPPPSQVVTTKMGNSPPKRAVSSNYLPQQASARSASSQTVLPLQRSQTQSPGTAYTGSLLEGSPPDVYQRPASVELPSSPRQPTGYSSIPAISTSRPRRFSQELNYTAPNDGREHDPMQRWKGSPVFVWGVGGTFITSFPKDVPRYGMNQSAPMIIRSPGEVKIRNIKDLSPMSERLASFPGPLKGKSKKKEVISWLNSGIQLLEHSASYLRTLSTLSHEDKRTEERILLWKILQVFIENDGALEGNAIVDKAVRSVLSPNLDDQSSGSVPLYATGADLSGISHSTTTPTRAEAVDPSAVDQLRKYLLRGDREKAVWEAVDKRLWAHAMLISNTFSTELYKQVVQEFVQKEVKNIGENTESLAALYEIFAGNFEESIDELVPPSARAGFQMVSTSNATGPSKDALDGLDRWRETLGLVLSNRSTDDSQALNALGKLLSGYGRVEAAHICFLFARTHAPFGGIDDPLASIVLIGSDHLRQPYEFDKELEPILLSEVFEYGLSLSSTSNVAISSPHLAIYKLQHALTLAEYGYREKALQYCEAIAASITSQTRRSPYHHALLVSELDDLSKRLKQSPKDEKSSWISKPSIDKVSGSVWSTFNKFVAGDENDSGTPGSTAGSGTEIGPFARIAGGTPTISRSPSNSDLYGSYNGGLGINATLAQAFKAGSRYAPGGSYTPPAEQQGPSSFQPGTSYGSQPRSSFERGSSGEHGPGPYEPIRRGSGYQSDLQQTGNTFNPSPSSSFTPQSSYTTYGDDFPYNEHGPSYAGQPLTSGEQPASNLYSPAAPINPYDDQQTTQYLSSNQSRESQPSSGYEPPSSTVYEPALSGYTPPSYEPASMNDEPDSPIDTRPKKKSFMDDDEDDVPALKSTPESRERSKEEKDREAQEVFRKAAEADGKGYNSHLKPQKLMFYLAARAKEAGSAKKGWGLSGWFGGGKKEATDTAAQPNKPIVAKLGEESSFVYDPNLKRWVNKKAGAENTPATTATPPPPRASGPPRTISSSGPLGPTPVPRMGTPPRVPSSSSDGFFPRDNAPPASAPPAAGGLAAPPAMIRSQSNGSAGSAAVTRPPSRPSTGMSTASSIDDLLGPASAGGRKGTARAKKKGRGYVDVMGEKAAGT